MSYIINDILRLSCAAAGEGDSEVFTKGNKNSPASPSLIIYILLPNVAELAKKQAKKTGMMKEQVMYEHPVQILTYYHRP